MAVVGYPDERLGERVCACIVARATQPKPTLDEIVRYLRDERHLSVLKLPERVIHLDALPRSPNSKVIKSTLRGAAATRDGHQ